MAWDDVLFYVQLVAGLSIIPILLWRYWSFRWEFYDFTTSYLGLIAIPVLLYLLVYAQLGTGLGLPYLFWHENFVGRLAFANGATLLLGVLGVIAFYLDRFPWNTDRKTVSWLRTDECMKQAIAAWWSRRLPWISATPPSAPLAAPPTWIDRARFAFNVLIDPVSITPFQAWLDPKQETAIHLQRFLRTARTPFLLLLLAPAVLPRFFAQVPREAPTEGLGPWRGTEPVDITQSPSGYVLGIATWLAGIALGVLLIKILIRVSDFFYSPVLGNPAVAPVNFPPGTLPDWATAHSSCVRVNLPQGCPGSGCPRREPGDGEKRPPDCWSGRQLCKSTRVFTILFLAIYLAMGLIRWLMARPELKDLSFVIWLKSWLNLSPGFVICAVLALLAMTNAVVAYMPRWLQVPVTVGLIVWLGIVNNGPFKLRFEMPNAPYYSQPVNLRSRVDEVYFPDSGNGAGTADHAGLIVEREALDNWKHHAKDNDCDMIDQRPKLVLVAVSGGASRSAYWTAVVLDRLEKTLPGFGRRVRIISGASGGMLGTACYVTYRRDVAMAKAKEPQPACNPDDLAPWVPSSWVEMMPLNSLDDVAGFIALSEIWKALWPTHQYEDRGIVLEKSWPILRYPLTNLAGLEREGLIPSLIFSPMMVDDGRRLMISNLDLFLDEKGHARPMLLAGGPQINYSFSKDMPDGVGNHLFSLSGMELYRLFPQGRGLFLSTAVRMSATFPYVSPAVNLPSLPPRRVVDAGYYDNYGIQVATAWIKQNCQQWLDRCRNDEVKICFPPGPERNLRLKRLEQLRNYERVVNLKRWWQEAGRRK
jgi:hypothetical protein